jgi:anti-sigma regulatory factor (Ser/Thr protein kinase)
MIVLESLDLAARHARLRALTPDGAAACAALGRLTPGFIRMGVERVELTFADGRHIETNPAPYGDGRPSPGLGLDQRGSQSTPTSTLPLLRHTLWLDGETPTYVAAFEHRRDGLGTISLYLGVVLETSGELTGARQHLLLSLYELCSNTLEHGRLLGPRGDVEIGIRIRPGSIDGWIRDCCERFDPGSVPIRPLPEHVVARPNRGYGLHMARRILDTIVHEFDGTGNVVRFRKEIPR